MDIGGRVTHGAVTEMAILSGRQFSQSRRGFRQYGANFLCTGCTVSFLFPTKAKYLHPCKQFGGAKAEFCSRQILSTDIPVGNGKEPLWFGFFFAYMDVGKGREQDAEALPTWT